MSCAPQPGSARAPLMLIWALGNFGPWSSATVGLASEPPSGSSRRRPGIGRRWPSCGTTSRRLLKAPTISAVAEDTERAHSGRIHPQNTVITAQTVQRKAAPPNTESNCWHYSHLSSTGTRSRHWTAHVYGTVVPIYLNWLRSVSEYSVLCVTWKILMTGCCRSPFLSNETGPCTVSMFAAWIAALTLARLMR